MGYYKRLLTCFVLYICSLTCLAQTESDTTRISPLEHVVNFAEQVLDVLTIERNSYSLALYPAASYSGRTGLAIGVMPMLQLHNNTSKPTTITPSVLISTNKMFEIQCVADVYWGTGHSVTSKAEFFYLPDKYYGIGNDDKDEPLAEFDFYRYMLTSDAEFQVGSEKWKVGASVDFTFHDFNAFVGDTATALKALHESERWSNGIGFVAGFDNRDNVLNPHSGWYVRLKTLGYLKTLGSRSDFCSMTFDARYYVALSPNVVVANQLYWNGIWGEAPFHKLSSCGGTRLGRAIPHMYKYIDNFAWLVQSEARFPVYWRIGATAFVAAGNVSSDIIQNAFDDTHFMLGAGLRFKVFPNQGLNIRLDAGIDSRGEHAVYFNIREAF